VVCHAELSFVPIKIKATAIIEDEIIFDVFILIEFS
jgi:hypothetical protein